MKNKFSAVMAALKAKQPVAPAKRVKSQRERIRTNRRQSGLFDRRWWPDDFDQFGDGQW